MKRRSRLGAPSETPDSNGSMRCLVRDTGRPGRMNESAIIVAGMAAAKKA